MFNVTKALKKQFQHRLDGVRARCNSQKHKSYKDYGGKGIKCLINMKDIAFLWKRDRADLMINPTLDRIANNGNYELSNLRFIELSENISRRFIDKTHCCKGHEFSEENTYWRTDGRRRCRICQRINQKRFRDRRSK